MKCEYAFDTRFIRGPLNTNTMSVGVVRSMRKLMSMTLGPSTSALPNRTMNGSSSSSVLAGQPPRGLPAVLERRSGKAAQKDSEESNLSEGLDPLRGRASILQGPIAAGKTGLPGPKGEGDTSDLDSPQSLSQASANLKTKLSLLKTYSSPAALKAAQLTGEN